MTSGWAVQPFDDCIEKVDYTQKVPRTDFLTEGAFPVVSQEEGLINGYWDNEADVFRVSTPVVVFGDHTKIVKYVDFDFVLGADGVKVLKPRGFLVPKFFYYQVQAANLRSLGYARHYRLLKELEISYPAIPEQERIVALLDRAFADVAMARANTRLTLRRARELFEGHLHSIFTDPDHARAQANLLDTCDVFADGDWVESKDQSASGIRLVQTGNVGVGFFRDRREKARYVSEDTFRRLRGTEIFAGDCLISRLPEPVGRSCLVPEMGERMITAVDCTIVRFKPDVLLPDFFNFYSQSADYLNAVERATTGTTRKRISRGSLGLVTVPVPPVADQIRIVRMLRDLDAEVWRLSAVCENKLIALDELTRSLTRQAFAGLL